MKDHRFREALTVRGRFPWSRRTQSPVPPGNIGHAKWTAFTAGDATRKILIYIFHHLPNSTLNCTHTHIHSSSITTSCISHHLPASTASRAFQSDVYTTRTTRNKPSAANVPCKGLPQSRRHIAICGYCISSPRLGGVSFICLSTLKLRHHAL